MGIDRAASAAYEARKSVRGVAAVPVDQTSLERARENSEETEPLSVRLPKSMRGRFRAVAKSQGLSETDLMKEILRPALKEWEQLQQAGK